MQYAAAMAGYLRYLAGRLDKVRASMKAEVATLRASQDNATHSRTSTIVAELFVGFKTFLDFAVEVSAISAVESKALSERAWRALQAAAAKQDAQQKRWSPPSGSYRVGHLSHRLWGGPHRDH